MRWIKGKSLRAFFRRQAIRWSLVSLCLFLIFAVPAFFWVIKTVSEKHILSLAQVSTFAFRPAITNPIADIRLAQVQMIEALHLGPTESIVIRDRNLKAIYNDGTPDLIPLCPTSTPVCWSKNFGQMEHLEPIYFDKDQSLFGYADYRLSPVIDRTWVLFFLLFVPLIFIIQALGLSSALDASSVAVTQKLSQWANKIRRPMKDDFVDSEPAPFEELGDMQTAINGLQNEIIRLQEIAVDESKTKLQLIVLKEVGHDLRNPISQLEKYIAILVASTRRTGVMDTKKVDDVNRLIKRVKDVSEQIKGLQDGLTSEKKIFSISEQGRILVSDMAQDSDVIARRIFLGFDADQNVEPTLIAPVAFQRIFENLVRNAIDAVPDGGAIQVNVKTQNGRPTLIIRDNGHGITDEDKPKIFDFLFTTKGTRGTGLGLGIVRDLCAFFSAEIDFQSALNQGTTFRISFLPTNNIGVAV